MQNITIPVVGYNFNSNGFEIEQIHKRLGMHISPFEHADTGLRYLQSVDNSPLIIVGDKIAPGFSNFSESLPEYCKLPNEHLDYFAIARYTISQVREIPAYHETPLIALVTPVGEDPQAHLQSYQEAGASWVHDMGRDGGTDKLCAKINELLSKSAATE